MGDRTADPVIFVDTSVLDGAFGTAGSVRDDSQEFFLQSLESGTTLVTSAVVLFEVVVREATPRVRTDLMVELVLGRLREVWALEAEDVFHAQRMRYRFPDLHDAGLIKLASCWRRGVHEIHTYDGALCYAANAGRRGTRLTGRDRARLAQQAWRERRRSGACGWVTGGEPPSL